MLFCVQTAHCNTNRENHHIQYCLVIHNFQHAGNFLHIKKSFPISLPLSKKHTAFAVRDDRNRRTADARGIMLEITSCKARDLFKFSTPGGERSSWNELTMSRRLGTEILTPGTAYDPRQDAEGHFVFCLTFLLYIQLVVGR